MYLFVIEPDAWNLEDITTALQSEITLGPKAIANIEACRAFLDEKMKDDERIYYGINTGFGSLCDVRIPKEEIQTLQYNLVISHACGTGAEVPSNIVKLMLLLKIKNFVYGNSGVSLGLVNALVQLYNHDIIPVVYTQGSLGASGDLAPLAHLSLPLLGLGHAYYKGKKISGAEALNAIQGKPIKLQSKEGLALLNGTQFMNAYGLHCLLQAKKLLDAANHIAALSFDAFNGTLQPFHHLIGAIRPHKGQSKVAEQMRNLLKESPTANAPKSQVQDPYSFRCIPQVHGATYDVLETAESIFLAEANSVTDNPLIFPADDLIVSGGNFHGQILALHLDFLKIAMAELANISERRIYLLLSGQRGLPPFLAKNAGLQSGLMIAQYTAAGIVSANKQLATPASIDSIVSSNGQEDHVSMGANAAIQLYTLLQNVQTVIAIEWLTSTHAFAYKNSETSPLLKEWLNKAKSVIQESEGDVLVSDDIAAVRGLLDN